MQMVRYISKFHAKKIAWANLMRKWIWLQFVHIIMLKTRDQEQKVDMEEEMKAG